MEWNGMEWNGMEWNGMEWNGMEWNGMEWNGMEWNGMEWNGMDGGGAAPISMDATASQKPVQRIWANRRLSGGGSVLMSQPPEARLSARAQLLFGVGTARGAQLIHRRCKSWFGPGAGQGSRGLRSTSAGVRGALRHEAVLALYWQRTGAGRGMSITEALDRHGSAWSFSTLVRRSP